MLGRIFIISILISSKSVLFLLPLLTLARVTIRISFSGPTILQKVKILKILFYLIEQELVSILPLWFHLKGLRFNPYWVLSRTNTFILVTRLLVGLDLNLHQHTLIEIGWNCSKVSLRVTKWQKINVYLQRKIWSPSNLQKKKKKKRKRKYVIILPTQKWLPPLQISSAFRHQVLKIFAPWNHLSYEMFW